MLLGWKLLVPGLVCIAGWLERVGTAVIGGSVTEVLPDVGGVLLSFLSILCAGCARQVHSVCPSGVGLVFRFGPFSH